MKNIALPVLAAACGLSLAVAVPSFAGAYTARENKQSGRIVQCIASGELTQEETKALAREQRRIEKARKEAWADGVLTSEEAALLQRMQDRASDRIYRMKHNTVK